MLSSQISRRRSHSVEDSKGNERKRRRKALSCFVCRSRKLKCDREYPACSRCRNAGQPQSCVYESAPFDAENPDSACLLPEEDSRLLGKGSIEPHRVPGSAAALGHSPGYDDMSSKLLLQAKQISHLETRLALLESTSNPQSDGTSEKCPSALVAHSAESEQWEPELFEPMFFHGEAFSTKFYGSSDATALFARFPDLRLFMKDAISTHTSLARLRSDLKVLKVRARQALASAPKSYHPDLLRLLPKKDVVDRQLKVYFETFELIYHILHVTSFWKEYHLFWDDPQKGEPSFVAILLLALAIVGCTSPKQPSRFVGHSSVTRQNCIVWLENVETWHQRQSPKHADVSYYQVLCLLSLAKEVNAIKKKRAWTTTGILLSIGIAAGLHRDPSLRDGKISVFDQEMRRRLWAVLVEFELHNSLARGMPTLLAGFKSDCATPRNIHDEEFDESSQQLPATRPVHELTAASFLHAAGQSLSLRTTLVSIINNPGTSLKYQEILHYDEKIRQQLRGIFYLDSRKDSCSTSNLQFAALNIQFQQLLIVLHSPFARRTGTHPQYGYSKLVCFEAATAILDQHSRLTTAGDFTLGLRGHDINLAALCLCHNIFTSGLAKDDVVHRALCSSFPRLIQDAFSLLEARIMRLGEGLHQFWFLSAAYGLAQSTSAPEDTDLQKRQSIERVSRLFYVILASQEDPPSYGSGPEAAIQPGLVKSDRFDFGNTGLLSGSEPATTDYTDYALQADGPAFDIDFLDLSEWTLDSVWPFDTLNL